MTTATGVSPNVSTGEVATSMVVFTLLYGALAAVEVKLMVSWIRHGPEPAEDPQSSDDSHDEPVVFAY